MNTAERKYLAENPKFKIGNNIKVNKTDIEGLKPGKYKIVDFNKSLSISSNYFMIYGLKSLRKNAKENTEYFAQEWVETNSEIII